MAIARLGRNEPNPWLLGDLDPRDPRPLSQQIAARVREAIDSGVLTPGGLVPGVGLLSRRYGVSASTAGKVTRELAVAGLVRTYPGRGSYIAGGVA